MFAFNRATLAALLVAAALIGAWPAGARANPVLEIEFQSGAVSYTSAAGPGPLIVSHPIGSFTTSASIGTATAFPSSLDLSTCDISSAAGGTLIVTLSASGFTNPVGAANWLSEFSGSFVYGSGTVKLQTYLDTEDDLLGKGAALSTLRGDGGFDVKKVAMATTDGPFALTEVLTISTAGPAEVSLDGSIVFAPEPASMSLLGAGLSGLIVVSRRKRHGSQMRVTKAS